MSHNFAIIWANIQQCWANRQWLGLFLLAALGLMVLYGLSQILVMPEIWLPLLLIAIGSALLWLTVRIIRFAWTGK